MAVALFVGAWIETLELLLDAQRSMVALFVGAWIETFMAVDTVAVLRRRTLRGCVD